MISEAVKFLDRVAAVDFAMRIVRPDVSEERRTEVALTYAARAQIYLEERRRDRRCGDLLMRHRRSPAPADDVGRKG